MSGVLAAKLESLHLVDQQKEGLQEILNFLKFVKRISSNFSTPLQIKCILKDLYPNSSDVPPDVGESFISANQIFILLRKTDFCHLVGTSIKELLKSIADDLKKEVDAQCIDLKEQAEEIVTCLDALQRNSLFNDKDMQDLVEDFIKELMDQLEENYQNRCGEEKLATNAHIKFLISTFLTQPACLYFITNEVKVKLENLYNQIWESSDPCSNPYLVENITAHLMIFRESLKRFLENKTCSDNSCFPRPEIKHIVNDLTVVLEKMKPLVPDYLTILIDHCLNFLGNCV